MLTEPGPQPVVSEERLDACLSAVAAALGGTGARHRGEREG